MKKTNLLLTLVMGISGSVAVADEVAKVQLQDCTLEQLVPEFADFFGGLVSSPPAVGDKITLDLNQPQVTSLDFESGSSIPISAYGVVLNKKDTSTATAMTFEGTHQSPTSDYIAVLTASLSEDSSTSHVIVQILRKRFRAGSGQLVGHMSLHEAHMACVAKAP